MRLTRVFVERELASGTVVELPPETASHLAKVLRARAGDDIVLFCGDGREFRGTVESVRGSRVIAAVGDARPVDRESPLDITLVQCVPRGDRMDFIVQKATELGAQRIVPVLSRRSVVRLDGPQGESKAEHWRAVARNACEQCGRNRLPHIDAPMALLDFLGRPPPAGMLLVLEPDTESGPGTPRAAAPGVAALTPGSAVAIGIGPEGGFAPEELDAFGLAGFVRMSLGPRILRTETAALAALTWLQTSVGDMRP